MASIEAAFSTAIKELENEIQAKNLNLQKELAEVDQRRTELLAERETIGGAFKRRANFSLVLGGHYQCPRCWIVYENRSAMRPVTSSTNDDFFDCITCGYGITVPSGNI